jgi:hypothetical protein
MTEEELRLIRDANLVALLNRATAAEAENAKLREALRSCRRAVSNGREEPRRNVREIVDEALLAAIEKARTV